jgi:HSP20 family protein
MLSLVRREPRFGWGLMNLRDEVDRMFRDLYDGHDYESGWMPSVDIAEDKDRFVLSAELPGVKKEDVKINVHNNTLTIEGEKKGTSEKKDDNYYKNERFFGKFTRSFTLNTDIDTEKIKADFEHGVLTVSLPKTEKVKPRQIAIN